MMIDLKLNVLTSQGKREEFSLAEMWDYYNENVDHFLSGQQAVSFGDYLSGQVWNWAASGNPAPMLIDGWLDHDDLAEYVIIDKLSTRQAFADIQALLDWIDRDVDLNKRYGHNMVIGFLTYVECNNWEFINFDEIDNFMQDTWCGFFDSAWEYVTDELIGNRFIAAIPNWLDGAIDEEVAVENLVEQGLMEIYDGRTGVYIFRQ